MRWPKLVLGFTQSTPVDVSIDIDGVDEDGAPIFGAAWSGYANYQDHTVERFEKDKASTAVRASIYIDGDPFPTVSVFGGGHAIVFGDKRRIVQGSKARNPDATVNYTRIDLQ